MKLSENVVASPEAPVKRGPLARSRSGRRELRSLVVDARMLFSSGIGRYLREVIRRWPAAGATGEAYVVNSAEQQEWLSGLRPGAGFIPTDATIYSLREQTMAWQIPRASVYWVPHYNAPWRCRARLVTTVHDAAPLVLREAFPSIPQRLAARFYFRAVRRSAQRILTVSHFTASELVSHARIPRERIDVVPNGVDETWTAREELRPRAPERLLFVGNLKAHKNVSRLLDAIELLRLRSNRNLTLEIVGQSGGFRAGLESRTQARLDSTPWVRRHGRIDDTQLRGLYAEVGALVFPSLYEGFGLPMLEAMAAGCPVLASREGALPEVGGPDFDRGGGVVYFDPRDPNDIAERLEVFLRLSPTQRVRMATEGRRRAALYSWHVASRHTYATLMREVERARDQHFS